MRILSLDISTKTGYALIDELGTIEKSGVIKLNKNSRGGQIKQFHKELILLINHLSPSHIAIEKPFFRGAGSRLLETINGIAEMLAYEYNLSFSEVHNSTLKKWLTGDGKAKKPEIIQAIKDKGYNPQDDNEADAINLALYSFEKVNK